MNSVLFVSGSAKSLDAFKELLLKAAFSDIVTVPTAGEAKRIFIEKDFDLCVINAPLKDEFGTELAITISEKLICQVILLVKADLYEEISGKAEDYGVITISKPISRDLLWNAIKLAGASIKRMNLIKDENRKLLQKIEDIKIVDRAKCLLISYLSLTEPEAHRYIEKQAMDMRTSRRAVAEEILKTYDNY
ncbi:MAG: response regulator [Clostridiales bacterium]|jgi:AmiR/NasT family two-component response regulator|nr:response regulator [Clostridiales bacterium]